MKPHINPELLIWSRKRAGKSIESLRRQFPKIQTWENGEDSPTFKQLEKFAGTVHVPMGMLFLPTPPAEQLPIPDFRTIANALIDTPSTELIDTLHFCQQRQTWYRRYARMHQLDPIPFIGSVSIAQKPLDAANKISNALGRISKIREVSHTWEDALRNLIDAIENIGILVMINGVAKHNTHRPLDVSEFRGFALADDLAPVIFINGRDSKAGQIFTLAHELAHIFLGESALSDASVKPLSGYRKEEIWCNAVAAELLVPTADIPMAIKSHNKNQNLAAYLAKYFKVSRLVALRRLLDLDYITLDEFEKQWEEQQKEWIDKQANKAGGGDFYRTATARNSKRFTSAVIRDTLAGQTLYRDAYQLLSMKPLTFNKQAKMLGRVN